MCKERYINPFTDFGFKRLFGTEANKHFLISFLNSLFEGEEQIEDINYQNVEKLGLMAGDRNAIFDLYCTTASGQHIIVEMQNAYQRHIVDRSIYYSTFPVQEAALKGEWDFSLPKIYTVAFLNFRMSEYVDSAEFKHVIRLSDIATGHTFTDRLTYVYLEMPKFVKELDDLDDTLFDKWMYVIKNLPLLDEYPTRIKVKIIEEFFRQAEIMAFTREERMAYEISLKNKWDYDNILRTNVEDAKEQGREQGREEGRMEGRMEGLLDTARNMAKKGFSAKEIQAITGLPADCIENL